MRRFEFVQGGSAKFWEASIDGSTFITVYGRLGATGQRKEKAFASAAAAQKELDKKVSEKLREGYVEVVVGTSPVGVQGVALTGAKGAAAASKRLELPARIARREPTSADITGAVSALDAISAAVAGARRSWVVGVALRKARKALSAIAGASPDDHPALRVALDAVLAKVGHGRGKLSPARAIQLLWFLDTLAFESAATSWVGAGAAAGASGGMTAVERAVLETQMNELGDPELGLRLVSLLVGRHDVTMSEQGWARRWGTLAPLLEKHLATRKGGMRAYLAALDPTTEPRIARRVRALRGEGRQTDR